MSIEPNTLADELAALPAAERLQLARGLIESVLKETEYEPADPVQALLAWVGRFEGGPGDTAERAEAISENWLIASMHTRH